MESKQPYETPSIESQQQLSTITEVGAVIVSGMGFPEPE